MKGYKPKTLIVDSALKYICHKENMNMSEDLKDTVEERIKKIMKKAISRARDNQRTTVMSRDI